MLGGLIEPFGVFEEEMLIFRQRSKKNDRVGYCTEIALLNPYKTFQ